MEKILTGRMLRFIDTLMVFVDPEIKKLNEIERMEFIFLFIQSAGFLELTKCKVLNNMCKYNDNAFKAFECMPSGEKNYLSIALDCLSSHGACSAHKEWHYFATSLATIFSHEDKSVFRWLLTTIKTINYGIDHISLQKLSEELHEMAITFALDNVLNIDAERCAEHYLSQTNRSCRLH